MAMARRDDHPLLAMLPRGGSRATRILERNTLVAHRNLGPLIAGFVEPVFYLFAIGVGVGALVGDITGPSGEAVDYRAFVAPGLLAASAMNGAIFESTFNVFFKLRDEHTYDAMLATPLEPFDIALGEIGYATLRAGLYATGFLGVMALAGLATTPWVVMVIPAALLIGLAFSAVGMAATTWMTSWQHFDLVSLVSLPMFLFSATFYPLSIYPPWLQGVMRLSPLYHGVELVRAATFGIADWSLLAHAVVLVAMGAIGLAVTGRRIELLLRT